MIHTTIKQCGPEDIRADADVTCSVVLENGQYVLAQDWTKPLFAQAFCLNCGQALAEDMEEDLDRAIREHLSKAKVAA